jgi:septum site-determining protein MinC
MVSDDSSPRLVTDLPNRGVPPEIAPPPLESAKEADADADAPPVANLRQQVQLTSAEGVLKLILPPEVDPERGVITWPEQLQQLKQRLETSDRFWQPDTVVHLMAQERLLDARQLQALHDVLSEAQLTLKRVFTSRRPTALAAITAGYSVDQQEAVNTLLQSPPEPGQALAEPLYLHTTVRSGVEVRHPGTLIIMGDANPGSSLVAEGDILVWGRLRGTAHAGVAGNRARRIMALQMQPTQLRIADLVARPPDATPGDYLPEVAYIGGDTIRLARAQDFAQQNLNETLSLGATPLETF